MTYWNAFCKLKSIKRNGRPLRSDRCAALLGYCMILQKLQGDWKKVGITHSAIWEAKKVWTEAGIDPMRVDFSDRISPVLDGLHMDAESREVVFAHMGIETGCAGDDR